MKKGSAKKNTQITGATGEFYVAAYLSAKNLIVALPRAGVPSTDLLVTNINGGKTLSIQVKTGNQPFYPRKKTKSYYSWDTSIKTNDGCTDLHWYAFVNLNDWPNSDKIPEIFFVSSTEVSKVLSDVLKNNPNEWRPCYSFTEDEKGLKGPDDLLKILQQ